MGKYDPWDSFFAELEGDRVRLALDDLEQMTGVRLPPSARRWATWWSSSQYYARWGHHGWRARPNLEGEEVVFIRVPGRSEANAMGLSDGGARSGTSGGLILVGCVKTKRPTPMAAKDLYASALWERRRAYAERSGKPWFILSAEYGVLHPDDVIEPYDRYLADEPAAYRRTWSQQAARDVIGLARSVGARTVEIHAGAAYVDSGLTQALAATGIDVRLPLAGLRRGEQLAWYGDSRPKDLQVGRPGRRETPPVLVPRIRQARLVGPFEYSWPDTVERFDYGWEGTVESWGREHRFAHGVGERQVYRADRVHSVTFLDGEPAVEGVAADDYRQRRALLSLIKDANGRMVTQRSELRREYESFDVVNHREEIDAPYSRHGLAVRIREDDLAAWVFHALLRRRYQPQPLEAGPVVADAVDVAPVATEPSIIVERILEYGANRPTDELVAGAAVFSRIDEADAFLVKDPFAFLIAVISDYQIKAERAWALPYFLAQRLNGWGPGYVAAHGEEVRIAFHQRPKLHRFVNNVAEWIVEAAQQVLDDYNGDAGAIWGDTPTAAELQNRLRIFRGISQKKAAMAVEILERDLKIPIAGLQGSDVAYDVHVRRVMLRTGLADRDDMDHMVEVARRVHPSRPGELDGPLWDIGRSWCHARSPACDECALRDVCPRLIDAAHEVRGA